MSFITSAAMPSPAVGLQVKGLTDRGARGMMFDLDGKQTSVADYFEQRYHMRLRLPGAP
jgi:hypothetical protein